jgi:tetratricopeptide (TPR) repeat protein
MKTAAMGMGFLGGIIALLIYTAGYAGSSFLSNFHIKESVFMAVLSVLIPVIALWGATIVKKMPRFGGILMIISAAAVFSSLELNSVSLIISIPLIIGSVLGLTSEEDKKNGNNSENTIMVKAADNENEEMDENRVINIALKKKEDFTDSISLKNKKIYSTINAEEVMKNMEQNSLSHKEGVPNHGDKVNKSMQAEKPEYNHPKRNLFHVSPNSDTGKILFPNEVKTGQKLKIFSYILFSLAIIFPVLLYVFGSPANDVNQIMVSNPGNSTPFYSYYILLIAFSLIILAVSVILYVLASLSNDINNIKFMLLSKLSGYETGKIDENVQILMNSIDKGEKLEKAINHLLDINVNPGIKSNADLKGNDKKSDMKSFSLPEKVDEQTNISKLIETANALFKRTDYSKALENYDKAIKLKNNDFILFSKRANTYFMLRDYNKAIIDYDKALSLKPDSGITYYYRGYAKIMNGDSDSAKRDLEKAMDFKIKQASELFDKYCK